MRAVLQEYDNADGQHRILMTRAYMPLGNVIRFCDNETYRLADFPFNFAWINGINNCRDYICDSNKIGVPFDGTQLESAIRGFLDNVSSGVGPQSASWVLGNHDQRRLASRFGMDLTDGMIMVQQLLPGTPVTYYGEEIGMEDTYISYEDTQDPQGCNAGPDRFDKFSRDPARSPMQWDTPFNSGFSTSPTTWLSMGHDSLTVNIQLVKENFASHLNVYRTLVALSKGLSILYGDNDFPINDADAFSLTRIRQVSKSFAVLLNVDTAVRRFDLSIVSEIPAQATVVVPCKLGFRIDSVIKHFVLVVFTSAILDPNVESVIVSGHNYLRSTTGYIYWRRGFHE